MLLLIAVIVAVAAAYSEPVRYKHGEAAFLANRTRRESEQILGRLDSLIAQRALCVSGVTYVGTYEWRESEAALRLAVDVMRTRGWNVSLANVTLGGATRDSFFVTNGPCLINRHLEPAHCYCSLDHCGNARDYLEFEGQWWLGALICYQTVTVLHFTL